jgi:teichuronic acid biosynthesis glycosyltransferase TuaC
VTNMYPTAEDPAFGTFVATQIQSIRAAGADVTIEFVNGRRSNWEYARSILRVRCSALRDRYDVVHAHYGLTGFVCAFQPLPLVVSFCGDDLLGTPDGRGGATLKSRIAVSLSRIAAHRADAVICKSDELRDAVPRSVDRARIHVIGNGVDTSRFSPGNRSEARARLGVDRTELLVLFPHSRRQAAVKRFDLAEAAMARLIGMGVRARLWVVNGVPPERMPDYYRAADCMLLTSDHEGSPNTVKEALCCDLPVVSVDVGDVTRWVELSRGCFLVSRAPEDIARGLAKVLLGQRHADGRQIREEMRMGTVAARVIAAYSIAIASRVRRVDS